MYLDCSLPFSVHIPPFDPNTHIVQNRISISSVDKDPLSQLTDCQNARQIHARHTHISTRGTPFHTAHSTPSISRCPLLCRSSLPALQHSVRSQASSPLVADERSEHCRDTSHRWPRMIRPMASAGSPRRRSKRRMIQSNWMRGGAGRVSVARRWARTGQRARRCELRPGEKEGWRWAGAELGLASHVVWACIPISNRYFSTKSFFTGQDGLTFIRVT